MTVFITCNRLRKTRAIVKKFGDRLVDEGYNRKQRIRKFRMDIGDGEYKSIVRFCSFRRIHISNGFSARSKTYRDKAFASWTCLHDGRYRCVYCGKKLKKENVEVDHLYSVGAVRRNPSLQKKLQKAGIKDVNDVKNLVPSCSRCNRKKGAKLGRWIMKGKLGKHQAYWVARDLGRTAVFGALLWGGLLLFKSGIDLFDMAADVIEVLTTVVGQLITM